MSHRTVTHRATPGGSSWKRRAKRYISDERDPIGRAMRSLIITALTLWGLGFALTLVGCFMAATNPGLLLTMLGLGVYIAFGMGLAMLALSLKAGLRIWQYGTGHNRFSLVASPLITTVLIWQNFDLVQNSTAALGRALFSAEGLFFGGNKIVALLLALFIQGVMWSALFALPVLVMHGLGVNKARLNKPPHKLTDTNIGDGQTAFWHVVCGYAVLPLAVTAWLPFFIAPF